MTIIIREHSASMQTHHGQNSCEFLHDGQRVKIHCRFLKQGRTLSNETRSYCHPHPCFFRLFLFKQGTTDLKVGQQKYRMNGPTLYGLPDNMPFVVTYAPCNLVYFHLQIVDQAELPVFDGIDHVLSLQDPVLFASLLDAFSKNRQARMQTLVLQAIVDMAQPHYASLTQRMLRTQRFGSVMEMINSKPPALLNIDELAHHANFTRATLSKGFQRAMGISLKVYITQIYEQRAKELLGFSDKTIEEIATLLGHETPTYFYRKFKHITGMTPSTFRQIQNPSSTIHDSD